MLFIPQISPAPSLLVIILVITSAGDGLFSKVNLALAMKQTVLFTTSWYNLFIPNELGRSIAQVTD